MTQDAAARLDRRGFLISDLKREGSMALLSDLTSHFSMSVQPAVWVSRSDLENSELVDSDRFMGRHLRKPLLGEVGIALAHKSIYADICASSGDWWVVFEDDAQISSVGGLAKRVDELQRHLPLDLPCIVNLNHRAARQFLGLGKTSLHGLWKPIAPTYTATAYLLNRRAAEILVQAQTPIQSQADWPIDSRSTLFLQEKYPLVQPRETIPSLVDPTGMRSNVPAGVQLMTWSWLWYTLHREHFKGPMDYWNGVLLPRAMRHIYRSK